MNKKKIMISLSVVFSLAVLLAVFLVTPVQVKAEVADFDDGTYPTSFVSSTQSSLYSYSDQVIDVDAGWKDNQIYNYRNLSDSNGVYHDVYYNDGFKVSGSMLDTFTISFPYIFNKYLFFYKPVNYYPYNIWDEEWQLGYFDYSTGSYIYNSSSICSKNFTAISPNTSYYFLTPYSLNVRLYFYDSSYNFIESLLISSNNSFISVSGSSYLMFNVSGDYGSTYNNNISIYLASKCADYYIPHYSFYDVPLERDSYQIPNYDYWPRSNTSQTPRSLEFDLYYYISTEPNSLTYNSTYSDFTQFHISHYDLHCTYINDLNNGNYYYDLINLDFSNINKYSNYSYYVYFIIVPSSELTEGYFYYCYTPGGVLDDIILDYFAINEWWYEDYDGVTLSHGFTPRIYNNLGFDKTEQYELGYSNGYNVGYSSGSTIGSNSGYNSGYAVGYSKGFQDGETMNVGDPTVTGLIYSIFQAPVTVLMNLFSFTIFGTQVWYILVTLLVLGLVLWLLRKLLLR